MTEDWPDITEHILAGDMQPGPSQRWHFWCAAFAKKLKFITTEEAYFEWSKKQTRALGQEQGFYPSVITEIDGEEVFPAYELRLCAHANMVLRPMIRNAMMAYY